MNINIIIGHDNFSQSNMNKQIVEQLSKEFPSAHITVLSELYPHYTIDVKQEQQRLGQMDLLIFLIPVYWFGVPALLKKWQDEILTYGWAFGSSAVGLKDKSFVLSLTVGSDLKEYHPNGRNEYHLEDFFLPFTYSLEYCKMNNLGIVASGKDFDIEAHVHKIKEKIAKHQAVVKK